MNMFDNRLQMEQALELFSNNNLLELGVIADLKRQHLHPDSEPVTFVIDRNINYTNICSCKCKFCAFCRDINSPDSFVLEYETVKSKIQELVDLGGTQVLLQGGLNENLSLDYHLNLVSSIRKDFPDLAIHAFSPPEISYIAKNNNLSVEKLLEELILRGLSSIPGGGAEILSDEVRSKISPNKISADEWINIMEVAHHLGLNTTATMVIGLGEKPENIVEHLLRIRSLQDKTSKFKAFILWTSVASSNSCDRYIKQKASEITAYDYLKTLAVSRLVLDNIPNIQTSWVTQGLKVAQLSLRFGANDFGGTMLEENVVRSAGANFHKTTSDEIARCIQKAGFTAVQRDTAYNILNIYS
ncbi:MAG: dehypoxanthine futalosine cyclase [Candidatus Gastranaerophilales bacterium]|nr:dehypoxanthine futalosine cyclase [Candidatus Gastranaerophilales bacterium]